MKIVWDEPKRLANLEKHGLDFRDLTEAFFASGLFVPSKKGRWKGIGKRLAHADILAALAWKDECACH